MELTQEKHLDFVPRHQAILLKLIFDLLIAGLTLLLLCAHSTTHFE